jgi:transcription antitermination factor NusG
MERSTCRGVARVIEPLFPCYIFARCHLEECIDQIRYVNGVSSLVHFGPRIPSVPDQVIDELRECFESEDPVTVQDSLRAGAEVTVTEGAFLGAQGVVVRVLRSKQRVQILLDFLGRTTLAEVSRTSLCVQDRCLADLVPALMADRQALSVAGAI